MNVLGDDKKQQILALGKLGWSMRRIEAAVGANKRTISRYLKAAGIPVRAPRSSTWPGAPKCTSGKGVPTDSDSSKCTSGEGVPTDSAVRQWPPEATRAPAASACEPYREVIEEQLGRRRNAMAIWQELVDDHGFTGKYTSVKRFVHKLRGAQVPEARVVITTAPGEEAQVDYGEGPMVRDPETGKYKRTRLFVMTLGHSRKSVRLLTWRSSTQIWAELHERAFRRLGGVPRVMVLDNLREGVLTPDVYDPTLNPVYRDMLAHYGIVALPCRVRDPDRKGKVESGVGHAQKTPLRGQRFEHIETAQSYLDRWETNWADTRIHGTTKRQVAAMFADEKPHLRELPVEPFRYYRFGTRTVHLDGAVEVEAAYYHAPPGWIGRQLQVQWDGVRVRLIDPATGKLLRELLRQERGKHRMAEEDAPQKTPPTTEALLGRMRSLGHHVGVLCADIHRTHGEIGVRAILGVRNLVKKYGAAAADDAAKTALELGAPTYRFVRRYLERRPAAPLTLRQVDPIIRQLTLYRDLITRRTEE
jgi:transposase